MGSEIMFGEKCLLIPKKHSDGRRQSVAPEHQVQEICLAKILFESQLNIMKLALIESK